LITSARKRERSCPRESLGAPISRRSGEVSRSAEAVKKGVLPSKGADGASPCERVVDVPSSLTTKESSRPVEWDTLRVSVAVYPGTVTLSVTGTGPS
jgi:hypothetical protein